MSKEVCFLFNHEDKSSVLNAAALKLGRKCIILDIGILVTGFLYWDTGNWILSCFVNYMFNLKELEHQIFYHPSLESRH